MKRIKAVVLEKSKTSYKVLGADGSFRKIRNYSRSAEIGEEIEIPAGWELGSVRTWAGMAAIFLLVVTTVLTWTVLQPMTAVAFVSVDINPSVDLAVNSRNHVIKATARNLDAKKLLSSIKIKGESIDNAVSKVVEEAVKLNYLTPEEDWIVVGISPAKESNNSNLNNFDADDIVQWINKPAQSKGIDPKIAVFRLTSKEQRVADKEGLTVGEYALWQDAGKAGINVDSKVLKDKAERSRLLDNPLVQQQITSKNNVLKLSPENKKDKNLDKKNWIEQKKNEIMEKKQEKSNFGNKHNSSEIRKEDSSYNGTEYEEKNNQNELSRGNISDIDTNDYEEDARPNGKMPEKRQGESLENQNNRR